jgi:hypothetical protein
MKLLVTFIPYVHISQSFVAYISSLIPTVYKYIRLDYIALLWYSLITFVSLGYFLLNKLKLRGL